VSALFYDPSRYLFQELAQLTFERKIEIVVELQKAAAGARDDLKRRVWPI